jgi:hypothetical protein
MLLLAENNAYSTLKNLGVRKKNYVHEKFVCVTPGNSKRFIKGRVGVRLDRLELVLVSY